MIKKILLVCAVLVAGVLAYATTQPDTFALERRTTIAATPERIFAELQDFQRWDAWSPWAKLDTAMKVTYSGAATGIGSKYHWVGNSDVGEGSMEIIGMQPHSKVTIQLDFLKPIEAHNLTTFTLTPTTGGTEVVWRMEGENNYLSKVMATFISMDKMVGPDFEKGLAQLKTVAERAS